MMSACPSLKGNSKSKAFESEKGKEPSVASYAESEDF
jgi:hypothetical protein